MSKAKQSLKAGAWVHMSTREIVRVQRKGAYLDPRHT